MYRNDFVEWLDSFYEREVLNRSEEIEQKKPEKGETEKCSN